MKPLGRREDLEARALLELAARGRVGVRRVVVQRPVDAQVVERRHGHPRDGLVQPGLEAPGHEFRGAGDRERVLVPCFGLVPPPPSFSRRSVLGSGGEMQDLLKKAEDLAANATYAPGACTEDNNRRNAKRSQHA